MKRTLITLAVTGLCSGAYAANDFVDTAQVISAKPIIERVSEARQECDPAPAPRSEGSGSVIAPILGGVVGGSAPVPEDVGRAHDVDAEREEGFRTHLDHEHVHD